MYLADTNIYDAIITIASGIGMICFFGMLITGKWPWPFHPKSR